MSPLARARATPWGPLRSRPRLFMHAPYEAASRSLVPGRTVEDRFNRADSALSMGSAETGQAWTVYAGTFGIANNKAYASAATSPSATVPDSGLKDCDVRCIINLGTAATTLMRSIIVRGIDANNYLFVRLYSDSVTPIKLSKWDGGVETVLATGTVVGVAAAGRYNFVIRCNGNSIKVYVNGTLDIDFTLTGGDATKFNAAGCTKQGIRKNDSNTSTSNWWEDYRVDALNTTAILNSITDNSGNGLDASQATVAKQGSLLHDGTRWVFRWDGVANILTGSQNLSNASLGYVLIAIAQEPVVGTGCTMLGSSDETSATRFIGFGLDASAHIRFQQNNNGTADTVAGDTAIIAGAPYILEWQSNDAAYSAWVNGIAQTLTASSGSNSGDWFAETSARDNFTLGGLRRSDGDISLCVADTCTYIVLDSNPSAIEQSRLRKWVNAQNRFSIAL